MHEGWDSTEDSIEKFAVRKFRLTYAKQRIEDAFSILPLETIPSIINREISLLESSK